MKKVKQLLPIVFASLAAFVFMTPSGYALVDNGGLSGGCNTVTDCGATLDFYDGQCRDAITTINDCGLGGWTTVSFSCDDGCSGSCGPGLIRCSGQCVTPEPDDGDVGSGDGVVDGLTCSAAGLGFNQCTGQCGSCTSGYVMVKGKCLEPLDVVDDAVDVDNNLNTAYKIWDGTDVTEVVHVGTAGCADDQIPVSDAGEATGWKCAVQSSSPWTITGSDVYYDIGNVGIGTSSPNPAAALDVVGGAYGVWGEGSQYGGYFVNSDGSSYAGLGYSLIGIDASGSYAGGVFRDSDSSGAASVAIGDTGIEVSGNVGIIASGTGAGGQFEDSDGSGFATVGFGDLGIDATGNTAGGYFKDKDNSGYAYVGASDYGISAWGNDKGGEFNDIDGSGFAYAAWGDIGLYAEGNTSGGEFRDNNGTGIAQLGHGNYSLYGTGDLYISGKAGIGTNGPLGKMQVTNGSESIIFIHDSILFGKLAASGTGELIGAYFDNTVGTGLVMLGVGNVGVVGQGTEKGARFSDDDNTGYADIGIGNVGIKAYGDYYGGYFNDTNASDVSVYLSKDIYSVDAYGSINIRELSEPSLYINGHEALWYDGSTFSWGYGGDDNFFADKVGIGDDSPYYKLELPNNVTYNIGRARANGWYTYSDSRVKMNQRPISYGLNDVMQLQPKSYDHYSGDFEDGVLVLGDDYSATVGLIAQEVYEVIPELSDKPEYADQELWSLDYERLTAVLVSAIQELKAEKDALQEVVCELKPDAEICNQ